MKLFLRLKRKSAVWTKKAYEITLEELCLPEGSGAGYFKALLRNTIDYLP